MDPFIAEIRMFGFNFAPRGWAFCNGDLLGISQNPALFSLIGTRYGGNGQTTFGLPNLQGSAPNSSGQSTTGTSWSLGQQTGSPSVTLLSPQMPMHNHALTASTTKGSGTTASGQQLAQGLKGTLSSSFQARLYSTGGAQAQLAPTSVGLAGSNLPHNNMMPYLAVNFCIALQGVFPQRS